MEARTGGLLDGLESYSFQTSVVIGRGEETIASRAFPLADAGADESPPR